MCRSPVKLNCLFLSFGKDSCFFFLAKQTFKLFYSQTRCKALTKQALTGRRVAVIVAAAQALWVQLLRHCRAGGIGAPRKCSPEPGENHNLGAPHCSEGLDWKRLVQHRGVSSAAPRAGSPKEVSQETVLIPGEGSQAVVSPSLMALTLRLLTESLDPIPSHLDSASVISQLLPALQEVPCVFLLTVGPSPRLPLYQATAASLPHT